MTLKARTVFPHSHIGVTNHARTMERRPSLDSPNTQVNEKNGGLTAERRRLETFARVSGGWFWETDTEHRFIYMSESVREVTGVAPEWHYGKTRPDLGMPAAVTQTEWDEHLRMLQDHEPFEAFVFQRPGPDGLKWMQTSGIPVFSDDDVFLGYQGIATDITAQVEAQQKALFLASAIEQFSESFVLWGPDERLVICNKKFRDLNQAAPHHITPGTLFSDHVRAVAEAGLANPHDMTNEEWIQHRLARFRNPGEPIEMRRHDGTWLWIVEQRMDDGSTVTTATDITQVQQARSEVATVYRQLEDAIETLPACFISYDKDERIVMTNSRYRKSFNVGTPEEIHGLTLEELLRSNLERGSLEIPEGQWEEWISERLEAHRTPGGVIEQKMTNGEFLRFIDGKTSDGGIIRFGLDISELKQQQEELDRARKLAEDANQAKSEFLATISHEIRTPLNGILGMAYLLRDTVMDTQQTARLENIIGSGNALQVIINDVLDMSKIEAGAIEVESVPFDMAALVASVSSLFGDVAADKGLNFEIGSLPTAARHLVGDPARIRQILWNLLSNAVKFTQVGRVSVQFHWDGDAGRAGGEKNLSIEVRDTGIGIEHERLDGIFDPFVQADASTTRRFGGTGLGLSIINHLVELMGGAIRVESEPGKGSRFIVSVPFRPTDDADVERQKTKGASLPRGGRRPLHILVAEDHPLNALVTTELLQRHGHVTVHVENGLEAVTAMQGSAFDLILMDAHMPEMDGIEATRLIRAHPFHGDIPIIGLTADAFVNQHAALREAGMNAIVTKPFTDNDLISAIWSHVSPDENDDIDENDDSSDTPSSPDWRIEGMARFDAFAEARDPAIVSKLLSLGRTTTIDRLGDLEAAVAAGNSDQIRFSTHMIKGASGTIFATRLAELAAEIEQASTDIELVRAKFPAFRACVTETLEWWSELEKRLPNKDPQ
jgi:PAS domain S-box-containing protein